MVTETIMRFCGCFNTFFVYEIILLFNMNMFYLLIFIFDVLCNRGCNRGWKSLHTFLVMFPQKFTVNPDYESTSVNMEFSMSICHVP